MSVSMNRIRSIVSMLAVIFVVEMGSIHHGLASPATELADNFGCCALPQASPLLPTY